MLLYKSDLVSEYKKNLQDLFSNKLHTNILDSKPRQNLIVNQIPFDSALVEPISVEKIYETTICICSVINFTGQQLPSKIALSPNKWTPKIGQKILLKCPRIIDKVYEFLDMPLIIAQSIEEIKKESEYEIVDNTYFQFNQ